MSLCFLSLFSKVSYFFFFLIKFMGHSINQIVKLCIFFFPRSGKKKYKGVFFFFLEKVHEPFIQDLVGFYLFFLKVVCVFFFPTFLGVFCVFFFSCKSSHFIHTIHLEAVFFFFGRWKKKYSFFIHSIDFPQNVKKMNFYR